MADMLQLVDAGGEFNCRHLSVAQRNDKLNLIGH